MTTGVARLPTPTSSFLGRERELADANQLLRGSRLVTVTGPGGAGKTRFALELARRAEDERRQEYEDGVFASFLAPLRDPSLVLATIAQTLAVHEQPGQSALGAIASSLRDRCTLLVLDNLEHLLACRDDLGALLASCPGLSLLVTSRERLRIQGEVDYELPPMEQTEGVSLFCERALVEPSAAVEEVTARLEGLPLAIELAAARTKLLTPKQLLERLASRLDLLKAGSDMDPRQQTLRATIRWSYDLLPAEEQTIFARLSVFVGGCTLEAAEEVAHADAGALESLIDKSLLLRSGTELGPRFSMLETVREFGVEALAELGEADETSARYRSFFVRLAEELAPVRYAAGTTEERLRFHADRTNFGALLSGAIEDGDPAVALRLIGFIGDYMLLSIGFRESSTIVRAALALPGGEERDRACALLQMSRVAGVFRDIPECRSSSKAAEEIFVRIDDRRGLWQVLTDRLFYEASFASYAEAIGAGEQAIEVAREMDDRAFEVMPMVYLGATLVESQRGLDTSDSDVLRRGRELSEAAFIRARDEGTDYEAFVATGNLMWVLCVSGDYENALDLGQQALRMALHEQIPWTHEKTHFLWLGFIAAGLGAARAGAQLLAFALAAYEAEGHPLDPGEEHLRAETETLFRATLGDEAYEQAAREGEQLTHDDAVALAFGVTAPRRD